MINVHYGADGRVSALSVDTVKVNILRASILKKALETLEYCEKHDITIPIGSLIGELSSGKGPDIPITVIITDALECSVVTDFYESGINQTLHTVSLRLKVSCMALIPSGSCTFDITAQCPIGETVLIGAVPDAYTKINRLTDDITEAEIDDIYDFGASAN
jgi:sporulation protein YunB